MSHKIDWPTIPYFNRTWHNVTASRLNEVQYTNNNDYEIEVFIEVGYTSNVSTVVARVFIDGVRMGAFNNGTNSSAYYILSFTVPAGSTYKIDVDNMDVKFWHELY